MNREEFKTVWDKCIEPSYYELEKQDSSLYLRDGSFDSLCCLYNDIKNKTKRDYMEHWMDMKLDRHKIAACLAKAISLDRPVCKRIPPDFTGKERDFLIANEALAFAVALAVLRAYIALKLEKNDMDKSLKDAYRRICDEDFIFPDTIMGSSYPVNVCWAWHHNIINGHFDVLGAANILFMIENYSIAVYSR